MTRSVLIIDDEDSIRNSLSEALKDEGYHVVCAASAWEGLELIRKARPDFVLLDIWMPRIDGIEALRQMKQEWSDLIVVMMSGHGNIECAVKATKLGAYDFIEKPLSLERILLLLQNLAGVQDLARENQALRKQVSKNAQLLGDGTLMKNLREMIRRVARTSGSVLIIGENGTGKELVAQNIHASSPRFNKPFVEVNCAAIPEELIESELFGHEKGAFTGATALRRGKFDLAHGGTLFLDEIGDMSLKTQAKVLRILQEQKFERVGGAQTISVDVRIVAATNKDLRLAIQEGAFREDLYYRLNVIPFYVPPLRERREDIPLLVSHFISEFSTLHGRLLRSLSLEGLSLLASYSWPGNVRELRNLIERVVILTSDQDEGRVISASEILEHFQEDTKNYFDLSFGFEAAIQPENEVKSLRDARLNFEKEFILKTLKKEEWNISKTAQVLGIERSHLHRKIKFFGIEG